jgi:hypothetical protein
MKIWRGPFSHLAISAPWRAAGLIRSSGPGERFSGLFSEQRHPLCDSQQSGVGQFSRPTFTGELIMGVERSRFVARMAISGIAVIQCCGCQSAIAPGERRQLDSSLHSGMSVEQAEMALGFVGKPTPRPSWISSGDLTTGRTDFLTYTRPPDYHDADVSLGFHYEPVGPEPRRFRLVSWQLDPANP